jgi:quercetin dioxygenase-like cupin family protein
MSLKELSASKLSRRDVIHALTAAGAALAVACKSSISGEGRNAMKTTAQDAATVTPKVVQVKLENDRVRVLEFKSDPGDREDWHTHPAFVVYVVTGGTLRISTPDGKSDVVEFQPGDIKFREPVTHRTENIGNTRLHAILVELETR